MVGTDPAPFGAGTSEPHVTLDTSHHAGGLRPIESMAAAQMQQLETNAVQRRPEQQPSAAAAANVFTTAQHASLSAGMPGSVSGPCGSDFLVLMYPHRKAPGLCRPYVYS